MLCTIASSAHVSLVQCTHAEQAEAPNLSCRLSLRKNSLTKSSIGAVQAVDDRQVAAEQVLDVARRVWGRLEREHQ